MNHQKSVGNSTNTKFSLDSREQDILNMATLSDTDINSLMNDINKYAKENGGKLNTSQLRNIFSKVLLCKRVIDLQMMRPKLMYVAARQQNAQAKQIVEFFEKLIPKVTDEKGVKNYQTFMEAFVAYHKYHNPK